MATERMPAFVFGGPTIRSPLLSSLAALSIHTVPASRSTSGRVRASASPSRRLHQAANCTSAE